MGHKRKASSLEDHTFTLQMHHSSSPPSLTSASTHSSPSSMCTEPYNFSFPSSDSHSTTNAHFEHAPWLNLRTRKRVRDNRPAEETIYMDTIRKLFDAQKQIPATVSVLQEDAMDIDTPMSTDLDVQILDGLATEDSAGNDQVDLIPEPNQRSLHDFFARDRIVVKEVDQCSIAHAMSHAHSVKQQQQVLQKAALPIDFRPAYRPQQKWRQEGMMFGSESEVESYTAVW